MTARFNAGFIFTPNNSGVLRRGFRRHQKRMFSWFILKRGGIFIHLPLCTLRFYMMCQSWFHLPPPLEENTQNTCDVFDKRVVFLKTVQHNRAEEGDPSGQTPNPCFSLLCLPSWFPGHRGWKEKTGTIPSSFRPITTRPLTRAAFYSWLNSMAALFPWQRHGRRGCVEGYTAWHCSPFISVVLSDSFIFSSACRREAETLCCILTIGSSPLRHTRRIPRFNTTTLYVSLVL